MLNNIKNFFGNLFLKSIIQEKKGKHPFMPFDKAKEIGIIYDANDSKNENKIQQFASELRSNGKKVLLMGFVNEKELSAKQTPQINSEYFWKEKLTFFNLPNIDKIGQFPNIQFDLLFNIYFDENISMQGLSVVSKAKYKLGAQMNLATQIFDMTIDTGNNKDVYYLARQMEFYLNAI